MGSMSVDSLWLFIRAIPRLLPFRLHVFRNIVLYRESIWIKITLKMNLQHKHVYVINWTTFSAIASSMSSLMNWIRVTSVCLFGSPIGHLYLIVKSNKHVRSTPILIHCAHVKLITPSNRTCLLEPLILTCILQGNNIRYDRFHKDVTTVTICSFYDYFIFRATKETLIILSAHYIERLIFKLWHFNWKLKNMKLIDVSLFFVDFQ
jgi:hypothetical protein